MFPQNFHFFFFFFQLIHLSRKDSQRNVSASIQMPDIRKRNSNAHSFSEILVMRDVG